SGSWTANPGLAATGRQNGETVAVLTGLSNSFGITSTTGVAGSPYTLTVQGTLTNPNYNVAGTINGSWIINPANVTVTALSGSSDNGCAPGSQGVSATVVENAIMDA